MYIISIMVAVRRSIIKAQMRVQPLAAEEG